MLEVKTYEEVLHIMDTGYRYAQKLHGDGKFDHFELSGISLDHMEGFATPQPAQQQQAQQQQRQAAPAADSQQQQGLTSSLAAQSA